MKFPVASYTFIRDWTNCPYKAYRRFIKKDLPKFVHTEESKWGDDCHKALEVRVKHGTPLPAGMEKFEPIAAPLAAADATAEKMLGIDANGMACDFFAPGVWLRGKVDVMVLRQPAAAIFDYKTGKKREERKELEIHGLLIKSWLPTIQTVTAHFVWLQDKPEVGRAFDVSDAEKTFAEVQSIMNTVKNCMEIEDFPKRRNPLCGWCPCTDCEHNTSKGQP